MFKKNDIVKLTDKWIDSIHSNIPYKIIEIIENTNEYYIIPLEPSVPLSLQNLLKEKVSFDMIEKIL